MSKFLLFAAGVLFLCAAKSFAALPATTTQAILPATAPATAPARHQMIMPPGFVKVEVFERIALCEPADREWVTKALTDFQPSARPTTMPSDLADTFTAKHDTIVKQMGADLGVTDTAPVQKLFTEQVIPDLQKMAAIRPPMFYLICTKQKLIDLVRGKWSDPRFYYNRVADDVSVYQNVDLSIEHAMDDVIIPAMYELTDPPEKRRSELQKKIDLNEANIASSLSMQGQIILQTGFVAAIEEAAIKPLHLKTGEEWLGIGVEGLLSTRYASRLNGMRFDDLLQILTTDDPRNPIRAVTIDLIHPRSPNDLRPEYVPAYVDALRRRSVLVVNKLLTQAKPGALPKLFAAIKQAEPKDGSALIEVIKQTLGVDLSADVKPQ